jgi:hypothetical protein
VASHACRRLHRRRTTDEDGNARRGTVKRMTQSHVVRQLIEMNLLCEHVVVDQRVAVVDRSRRNRNFEIHISDGSSWFVKQATRPESLANLAHEAKVHAHLRKFGSKPILEGLPDRTYFDTASGILALSLIVQQESAHEYHRRLGRFPKFVGRYLGTTLAALHTTSTTKLFTQTTALKPWVLEIHKLRLKQLSDYSAASLAVIRIIQENDVFERTLEFLTGQWQASVIIHNDVKWDNVVITRGRPRVRLVDWESATLGDPAWDIGSVLAAYLTTWVRSIPVIGVQPPDGFAALASVDLNSTFAAQSAFWAAYRTNMHTSDDAAHLLLHRSMMMTAARLVVNAIEASQSASTLTGDVVLLLQLALNIMQRPMKASRHLCGLS